MSWLEPKGRFLTIALVAATSGALAIGCFALLKTYINNISPQREFAGLTLGADQDEVLYSRGKPDYFLESSDVVFNDGSKAKALKLVEGATTASDYEHWGYRLSAAKFNAGTTIDLTFDKKTHTLTKITCTSLPMDRLCPTLRGLKDGDSEEDIIRQFGKSSMAHIDKESHVKTISYDDVGVEFLLQRRKIYILGIHEKGYTKSNAE
jgi:hypothetical protein